MLLEQAFHALPEILCGSRYPGQDYESGIVTALTMAVLQELNGRNVPNPLSCIQGERLYEDNGFTTPLNGTRYLRADLVLDVRSLRVASKRLGDCYGWRHENWLEAKFFRSRNQPTNKTAPTAMLLADLLRLAVLVPERPNRQSFKGRYLLHIYDRHPSEYLSSRRNKTKTSSSGSRLWVKHVYAPGSHMVTIEDLDKEPSTVQAELGQMGNLKLIMDITNITLEPRQVQQQAPIYWCVLTRIDSVKCIDGQSGFTIGDDRNVMEDSVGDFELIRQKVAFALGQVPVGETIMPEDPAVTPPGEEPDDATDENAPPTSD